MNKEQSERLRLSGIVDELGSASVPQWWTRKAADQLRDDEAEIAQLRAENEALRTVTEEDVLASCRIYAQGPGNGWQMPCNQMRDAIQSFILSKESRRE